jgi:2-oxoglutarate dehydrogenase E2 component (dihydrolipoamide succinyltransferase)
MATNVDVPGLGESVSEAILVKWHKNDGDRVSLDDPLCELETDKANVDVPAPTAGVLKRVTAEGATVRIGETIATIDGDGKASAAPAKPATKTEPKVEPKPAAAPPPAPAPPKSTKPAAKPVKQTEVVETPEPPEESATPAASSTASQDGVRRVPMSKIRKKIAERLVQAQQTAAILTTFNEVDLSQIVEMRTKLKERFEKKHGVGLGFMSFFAKAVIAAMRDFPSVNAQIEGSDIVYHDYVNLGIAVSTERGLAVPVLRHAEKMSFAKIESEIKRLATATKEGKLGLDELSGGTFTITNGGVFGSLLSTPILNPPQSAILGMHAIQKRPVAINDQVVIRPMMYVALSYDHRLIDGRESVSYLVRLKELLEDPARLILDV